MDINDSGQVSGGGGTGSTNQAFVGTTSGSTAIPLPPGWSGAAAQGINASGQVAGLGQAGGPPQPWIGTAAGMTPIALPPGWEWAGVAGINDSGEVVGNGGPSIMAGPHYAFFGTASAITPIPLIPGWTEMSIWWADQAPHPLNNAGQVVGWRGGGWIWDPVNGSRVLSDLVPPEWEIVDGRGINDKGQIVALVHNGQTGYSGFGLLDPIPEPATGVLLAGGLTLLAALARRRGRR